MSKIAISRTAYMRLGQDELANHAENILNRCKGNAAYPMLNPFADDFQTALQNYSLALVAVRNRATDAVARKNQAKKRLMELLDKMANALEYNAPDETFVIEAGFEPKAKPQAHRGELQAPALLRLKPTGNRGELLLEFTVVSPAQVLSNAVEYSSDQGETWHNGTYIKRGKGVVHNLPSATEVMVRVRSIGTRSRISAWTAPVSQVVL